MNETGIDHQIRKEYIWAKKGDKIYGGKEGSKRGRTSVIAGYKRKDNEKDELIAPFYFNGHTTSEVFITWLKEVLIPVWNTDDVLVMDNASWHKTKKVRDLLDKNNIKYMYQTPYSPDLNPIEHCWANIKRRIRNLDSKISDFYERLEMVLRGNVI